MNLRESADDELVAHARTGRDAAFAALLHRYAPAVCARAPEGREQHDVLVEVFTHLMRRIHEGATPGDVGAWILAEAHRVLTGTDDPGDAGPSRTPGETNGDRATSTPTDDELDRVWSVLAPRWPDGRRRVAVPYWTVWVVTILLTIALSAAIPWLVLGRFGEEPQLQELRAFPIEERADPVAEDPPEEVELPTFEFPVPPEDLEPPEPPTPAEEPPEDDGPDDGQDTEDPTEDPNEDAEDEGDDVGEPDDAGPDDPGTEEADPDGDTTDAPAGTPTA